MSTMVPCIRCGVERPIKGNAALVRAAAERQCVACLKKPRKGSRIEMVPCVSCGVPRPVRVLEPNEIRYAAERRCRHCATHPEPDEIAVERLIAGSPVNSTPAERLEAVVILTRKGLSARLIAERLHVTERTVTRHRARAAA